MPTARKRKGTAYVPYARKKPWTGKPVMYPRRSTRYMPATTELKFLDTDLSAGSVTSSGEIVPNTGSINVISQGVGESQRVGRKAQIKYIGCRYNCFLDSGTIATATHDTCRILLFWDKQANGTAASVTDILESGNYQSFNNLSNKGRFVILADRVHSLVSKSATSSFGEDTVNGQLHLKVDIPVEFNSTTGAMSEIRSNNLGFLVISAGGHCEWTAKVRIRYCD